MNNADFDDARIDAIRMIHQQRTHKSTRSCAEPADAWVAASRMDIHAIDSLDEDVIELIYRYAQLGKLVYDEHQRAKNDKHQALADQVALLRAQHGD